MREMLATLALCLTLPQAVVNPAEKVTLASQGYQFTEGAIWTRQGKLLFSDIPANTIYELSGDKGVVYRKPSNNANGNQIDREGRLVTCEHGTRRVTRTDLRDGTFTVLADRFNGMRFNSPNDLVVGKDGSIYFTDPPHGISRDKSELGYNGVYRIRPTGTVQLLTKDVTQPNGIALSPDEKTLYVADDSKALIRSFEFGPGRELTHGKVFYAWTNKAAGWADGMRVDTLGNIWATGPGGVSVISPAGQLITTIAIPKIPTNVAWGDRDAKTLYITAQDSVYRLRTNVVGLRN
jgi:gluconolactonase